MTASRDLKRAYRRGAAKRRADDLAGTHTASMADGAGVSVDATRIRLARWKASMEAAKRAGYFGWPEDEAMKCAEAAAVLAEEREWATMAYALGKDNREREHAATALFAETPTTRPQSGERPN